MKRKLVITVLILMFFHALNGNLIAQHVVGDVNYDGKVDLTEAVYALQVTAGVRDGSDVQSIQKAIDSLPATGGTVYIRAGTHVLTQGIHISRSNVTISGEQGTLLKLGDGVKQPVFLIGTDKQTPAANDTIENIRISNLEIDGNKDNQGGTYPEYDPARCSDPDNPTSETCWIRNNGIDVRAVTDLWIENVNIHDARSGGVVVSWNSKRVFIANSSFHHNYFDGIALYDSEDIQISNVICYENSNAALSLDNNLKHVSFNGGFLKNNGDVGIFARDSEDISFHNLMVYGNGSHGCFISHTTPGSDTGVKRLFFSNCSFLNNNGYGLWLASTPSDSPDNTVIGCLFSGNTSGCIKEETEGSLENVSNVCK